MTATPPMAAIESWHAHLYFDAASRDTAWAVRERALAELSGQAQVGRFHERRVGPHPQWSCQLAFAPSALVPMLEWLLRHRDGLDVFLHPNTGDEVGDHRDRALWLGRSHVLDLSALAG